MSEVHLYCAYNMAIGLVSYICMKCCGGVELRQYLCILAIFIQPIMVFRWILMSLVGFRALTYLHLLSTLGYIRT